MGIFRKRLSVFPLCTGWDAVKTAPAANAGVLQTGGW
jgi:hypothetical protein